MGVRYWVCESHQAYAMAPSYLAAVDVPWETAKDFSLSDDSVTVIPSKAE